MSEAIVLNNKQTGYKAVAEYVRKHWKKTYYSTAIVWLGASYDGKIYHKSNEVVIPQDDEIEFLNDWWEGEKYIKIYDVINLPDVVEVVRCRDCKHWDREHIVMHTRSFEDSTLAEFAECEQWSDWAKCRMTRYDDYCSCCERSENGK